MLLRLTSTASFAAHCSVAGSASRFTANRIARVSARCSVARYATNVNAARYASCRNTARFAVLILAFLTCLTFVPRAVQAAPQAVSAERALFDAANRERVAQGLPALRWDESLAAAAREHAQRMAERNTLSHQLPGEPPLEDRARLAGARYSLIAENVAEGPSPDAIHSGWMHSPPHRANLLDRGLTSVGIAVVTAAGRSVGDILRGGVLFAVEDFSQSVANLSFEQQERQVSALLAARGLQLVSSNGSNGNGATDDARKTCEMDRGFAGSRPGLVVRYEVADLSRLPDDLEQRIQSGHYRGAAVGACDPGGSRGFARFRIAVLLF
jgi:uncharacterized protein YkwD